MRIKKRWFVFGLLGLWFVVGTWNANKPMPAGTDAAVVVIDILTGDLLAMVGGVRSDDPATAQVNAAMARRSPGSALKPFIYAAGFESRRLNEKSILFDGPIEISFRVVVHKQDLAAVAARYLKLGFGRSVFRRPVSGYKIRIKFFAKTWHKILLFYALAWQSTCPQEQSVPSRSFSHSRLQN